MFTDNGLHNVWGAEETKQSKDLFSTSRNLRNWKHTQAKFRSSTGPGEGAEKKSVTEGLEVHRGLPGEGRA